MSNETIVALATAFAESAIGLIRLSGPQALAIVCQLTQAAPLFEARKSILLKLFSIKGAGGSLPLLLDSCLVTYFPAPHSYTSEDVIEIACHGSLPVLKSILEECIYLGARLAERGEFTKRAFLNGKLDLAQAEAVQELISARTELGADIALQGIAGSVSNEIKALRQQLVDLLSHLEAAIDFPDEIDFLSNIDFEAKLSGLLKAVEQLIESAHFGQIIKEGIRVAIIGRPNVGKSTLLNALLGQDRALISHLPGTTRDTIEEMLNIDGIPVHIIDTAGLRDTEDEVEQMGIALTRRKAQEAHIVILVLDAEDLWTTEDKKLFEEYHNEKLILVINKIDLSGNLELSAPSRRVPSTFSGPVISISAKHNQGLENLRAALKNIAYDGVPAKREGLVITNLRQLDKLRVADQSLLHLEQAIKNQVPLDCLSIDLKNSIVALGEITGEQVSEEIINNIFDKFCVGK